MAAVPAPAAVTAVMVASAVNGSVVVMPARQGAAFHRTQRGAGAVAQALSMGMAAVLPSAVVVVAHDGAALHGTGLDGAAVTTPASAVGKGRGDQQGHGAKCAQRGDKDFSQRHDASTSKICSCFTGV